MSPPVKKPSSPVTTAMAVVLLCLLVLTEACGCCAAARASGQFFHADHQAAFSPGTRNREVGARLKVLKGNALQYGAQTAAATAVHGAMKRWKLREVPLGPDPLHHHGSSPRKPRITPP